MDIGIFHSDRDLERLATTASAVEAEGFGSLWLPQIFELDALTAIAVIARDRPSLRFGTCVVPIQRQLPMALAQQALTVSQTLGPDASGASRLALGIGLSHQVVIEGMWGLSWDRPVGHMSEYLDALVPLLNGDVAIAEGERVVCRGAIAVPGERPALILAALGPKMLELAGRRADGTTTWMVGPATLASHIAPSITAAAEAAGRPASPEIVVALPTCVTEDVAAARERAATEYAVYRDLPSYRAMLDREGAGGPEDVALIGSADQVAERVAGLFEAGATSFVASPFGSTMERSATRAALAGLLTS